MQNSSLVVSVVVYHPDFEVLRKTVDSVRSSTVPSQLVIVDNGLQDDVRAFAQSLGIDYIRPERNLGYGSAHNLAFQKYAPTSTYHLVLNPDVIVHPGCLEEMVQIIKGDSDVVLATPKVMNADGTIQRVHKRLPSFKVLFGRRFSYKLFYSIWPDEFDRYELKDCDLDQYLVIPSVSGCFMFFRTSALQKIGGFDERYFMYQEDIDLSRRAREIGIVVYSPLAKITHAWARGSHKSLKLTRMNIVSALKYFVKWFGKPVENDVLTYHAKTRP